MTTRPSDPRDLEPAPTRRRWGLFLAVLLIAAAAALASVYARDPVYRASASVLAVQAGATNRFTGDTSLHARHLLSEPVLQRLRERLGSDYPAAIPSPVPLRQMLSISPVANTDLLELHVDGASPAQLQRIANLWPEAYEAVRTGNGATANDDAVAILEAEQRQLQEQIDAANIRLRAFREANAIAAPIPDQGDVAKARSNLDRSLAQANNRVDREQERKAKLLQAIANGEKVGPRDMQWKIHNLRAELEKSRKQRDDFLVQYTEAFLAKDPKVRDLPETIARLERELADAVRDTNAAAIAEIDAKITAERATVVDIEQQLAALDGAAPAAPAADDKRATLLSMQGEVSRLEKTRADNDQRLAQLRGNQPNDFPPIQLVAPAEIPTQATYPNRERDALFALGGALGIAFLVTWLVEYLGELRGSRAGRRGVAPQLAAAADRHGDGIDTLAAPASRPPAGPVNQSRELNRSEVKALLAGCDASVTGYAALLLSGVSPYELPLLHAACFDRGRRRISLPGASARAIATGENAWSLIEAVIGDMDGKQLALPVAELDARLRNAARQAALSAPETIGPLSLWHTYVVFLVRQGISADALRERVGYVADEVHGAIAHLAPGHEIPVANVEFTHPALA